MHIAGSISVQVPLPGISIGTRIAQISRANKK